MYIYIYIDMFFNNTRHVKIYYAFLFTCNKVEDFLNVFAHIYCITYLHSALLFRLMVACPIFIYSVFISPVTSSAGNTVQCKLFTRI